MPRIFLNGTAMVGGADHQLVGDAELVAAIATVPRYRFWSVGDRYPALELVGEGGAAVLGEVYDMSYEQLRDVLLPGEPDGLELGMVELADSSAAFAMVLRRPAPEVELTDISGYGSWRAYRRG